MKITCMLSSLSDDDSNNDIKSWIVDISPWYSLICFGCYCLGKIGYDLLMFNDYPEEIIKLELDIKNAETDLKSRGFVLLSW